MYCDFYNLSEKPFNVTPDPKFLYLNARYREALASLHYGITERKGFVTLIGEAGTGKTTLLNRLMDQLDATTRSVLVFNTKVSFEEILEYIFTEFELPVHSGKKLYMLQRLNAFLLDELRAGRNVALLIDEGQDLEFSVLEDLRLLSNLETAKEKIIQIVLSGQPELEQKLASPSLRQLRQRIAVNCRLLPLSRDELGEYIEYRLRMAGCSDPKMFTRDAEDRVWHYARGIPRLVNVVCDNALVIGYAMGKRRINGDLVNEAAADLLVAQGEALPAPPTSTPAAAPIEVSTSAAATEAESPADTTPSEPPARGLGTWAVVAVVAVALAAGFISMGRGMFRQSEPPKPNVVAHPRPMIRPGAEEDSPPAVVGRGPEPKRADGGREPAPVRAIPEVVEPRPAAAPPEAPAVVQKPAPEDVPAAPVAQNDTDAPAKEEPPKEEPAAAQPEVSVQAPAPAVDPPKDGEADDAPSADDPPPQVERPSANLESPSANQAPAPAMLKPPSVPQATADAEAALVQAAASAGRGKRAAAGEPEPEAKAAPPEPAQVAAVPAPVAAPPEDSGERHANTNGTTEREGNGSAVRLAGQQFDSVVVRDGDSIAGIAIRKYGQASYTILDLLKLANPDLHDVDRISVGQKVQLPQLGGGFQVMSLRKDAYGLLIYSTPVASRAAALGEALRSRGFRAEIVPATIGVRKPVHRVTVGPMTSEAEAAEVGAHIQRAFREDDRLAQLGRY